MIRSASYAQDELHEQHIEDVFGPVSTFVAKLVTAPSRKRLPEVLAEQPLPNAELQC